MEMLERYHSLMVLLDKVGKVSGRKKIQKMVYLLQEAGWPFKERFDYHLYGPYSEELAVKLDEMKFMGLLEEKITETRVGYRQYEYQLSEAGKQYLRSLGNITNVNVTGYLEELAKNLSSHDARTLELVATLRFLKSLGYDDSEAASIAKDLKPEKNYEDNDIKNALAFLSRSLWLN